MPTSFQTLVSFQTLASFRPLALRIGTLLMLASCANRDQQRADSQLHADLADPSGAASTPEAPPSGATSNAEQSPGPGSASPPSGNPTATDTASVLPPLSAEPDNGDAGDESGTEPPAGTPEPPASAKPPPSTSADDPSAPDPADTSSGGGGDTASTSESGADTNTGGAGAGSVTGEPAISFIGRFDHSDPNSARFAWSGSGVIAAFEGQSVMVTLDDSGSNQFSVFVDGQLLETLDAQAGSQDYPLAANLAAGPHKVEIYRRTEASEGPSRFVGFDFGTDGVLLAPPPPRSHRLEVIGDSITCGYGNEGADTSCHYTPETENHTLSYGAISARALDADLVTVAWSGKGIVYNYDTDTNEPLPELYDRTIPTEDQSQWDFTLMPDAVVINLGTNDFSTDDDPTAELFHDRYSAFLEHIRSNYPAAFILCTVGPMLSGADLDAARSGIAAAVQTRNDAGDDAVEAWEMNIANNNPACDWHPSIATHQAMADALVAKLRDALAW